MKSKTNNRWLDRSLGFLLGSLLLVAAHRCEAQGNLVPNGSFEESDTCWPYTGFYYPGDGPADWFSGGFTPDYFQDCMGSGADNGVPLNYVGYQYPQDGEDYAGILTYVVEPWPHREYLMVQLSSPLDVGETYYASFYASVAWGGTATVPYVWLASNNIGALFTMGSRQWENGDQLPAMLNFAHVFHPWIITDTVGWTLVSGSFEADSAYQYLMIGNHFDNSHTDTVAVGSSLNPPAAYLFVDNVCVTSDPDGCPLATGLLPISYGPVLIYPNPAKDVLNIGGISINNRITVQDAMGRLVWSTAGSPGLTRIDVSEWPRGAYVLRTFDEEEGHSFKFVLTE